LGSPAMDDKDPVLERSRADRRRFRRVRIDLPGKLFVPSTSEEFACSVVDLSPGGASVACEVLLAIDMPVVLYANTFGRFEGVVARHDGPRLGLRFASTALKRERTAEQLTLFLNRSLLDESELRRDDRTPTKGLTRFVRHDGQIVLNRNLLDESELRRDDRTPTKGLTRFVRHDGQIVPCEVLDLSMSGISVKTDLRPPVGEFILIGQLAGRIARHHDNGIGIEFVGTANNTAERLRAKIAVAR
jgi:hypothetical protein